MSADQSKLTVRLPRTLLKAFRNLSDKDERSLNFVVLKALAGYARQRGELTDAQD